MKGAASNAPALVAALLAATSASTAARGQVISAPPDAPATTGAVRDVGPSTSNPAQALDSTATQPATGNAGDIIVTARRREENLQSVPVAVSAFSAATLSNRGIRDSSDIAIQTPSLYVAAGSFSSTNTNISLRGIASPGANITFDPSIGIYVDEVYLARSYGSLFDYFDISNVQVLRGVQGTLFGRNNTGGAVLIGTTKPRQEFSGSAELSYGNYDAVLASAVINVPLIRDLLAVRVGGQLNQRDGYSREVNSGRRLADRDSKTVRASALLTPSANSEFQVTYEYNRHKDSGPVFLPLAPAGRVVRPGLGFYDVAYDTPVFERGHDKFLIGRGQVDLGPVRVKLIGAHLSGVDLTNQDVDATDFATPALANLNLLRQTRHKQDSVEFQLSGDAFDKRLNYVGGLYYLHETARQPTLNVVNRQEQRLGIENKTKAAYAHVDFKITDAFQIGGGIRYTDDRKRTSYGTFNTITNVCNPAANAAIRADPRYNAASCRIFLGKGKRYVSYDVNANFQITPDILIYARTGKGQKSGGFNSAINNAGDLLGYDPEIATDYELGIKSELLDRRVRLNLAAYQTNYDDIQRNQIVLIGATTAIVVSNAAKARIRGAEAELRVHVTDSFDFGANYAYTEPKYLSFTSLDASGAVVDQRNFPFQYVSRHQIGYTIDFDHPYAGFGRIKSNLSYGFRSRYANYTGPDPASDQRTVGLLNARLAFVPESFSDLEVYVYGRNLTDEKYYSGSSFTGGVHFAVAGQPLMYGIGLKYRFAR